MNIEYRWSQLRPVLDKEGFVVAWIAELSARDLEHPELGWISVDGKIPVQSRKLLQEWTLEEALGLAEEHARTRQKRFEGKVEVEGLNWYEQLEARLKRALESTIVGSSIIPEPPRPIEAEIARIDKETELAISQAMHPMAEYGEQIGILREQIVHILNTLGLEPTPEFQRLHETAIAEIEKGRMKKEALYAENNQA